MFNGGGNAKKQAMQKAAEAALLTLCPNLFDLQLENVNADFTQDVTPFTKNATIPTDPGK